MTKKPKEAIGSFTVLNDQREKRLVVAARRLFHITTKKRP
jgi:hypothetical protein